MFSLSFSSSCFACRVCVSGSFRDLTEPGSPSKRMRGRRLPLTELAKRVRQFVGSGTRSNTDRVLEKPRYSKIRAVGSGPRRGSEVAAKNSGIRAARERYRLNQAVAQGADKISWTTGEQQNERYDLSKEIDNIYVQKGVEGSREGNEIKRVSVDSDSDRS